MLQIGLERVGSAHGPVDLRSPVSSFMSLAAFERPSIPGRGLVPFAWDAICFRCLRRLMKPGYRIMPPLDLGQGEVAEIFGGGINAFPLYKTAVAMVFKTTRLS